MDKNNNVVKQWNDDTIEVSDWIGEKEYSYTTDFKTEGVKKGKYQLAMSIIDTQQKNGEAIKLAIANGSNINESWTLLGPVTIKAKK